MVLVPDLLFEESPERILGNLVPCLAEGLLRHFHLFPRLLEIVGHPVQLQAGGLTPDVKYCKDCAGEVQLALSGKCPGEGFQSCFGKKVWVEEGCVKSLEPGADK